MFSNIDVINFFFRETVSQMMQAGQRFVDNPIYLSDLGEMFLYCSCTSVF